MMSQRTEGGEEIFKYYVRYCKYCQFGFPFLLAGGHGSPVGRARDS